MVALFDLHDKLISLMCTGSVSGGRLECTMQNIADSFFNTGSSRCYTDIEGIDATFLCNCKFEHHYLSFVNFIHVLLIYHQTFWRLSLCTMSEERSLLRLRGQESMAVCLCTR